MVYVAEKGSRGTYEGREVPPVLLSGHHGAVAAWRREQRIERTRTRRPDLYAAWEARQAEEGGA